MCGMIDVERLKIDSFFSAGKGGGAEVDYGYKGKGETNHVIVDKEGNPLAMTKTATNGDERLFKKAKQERKNCYGRNIQRIRFSNCENRSDNPGSFSLDPL